MRILAIRFGVITHAGRTVRTGPDVAVLACGHTITLPDNRPNRLVREPSHWKCSQCPKGRRKR